MKIASRILAAVLLALAILNSVMVVINFVRMIYFGDSIGIIGGANNAFMLNFIISFVMDVLIKMLVLIYTVLNMIFQFIRKQSFGLGLTLLIINAVCCIALLFGLIASRSLFEVVLILPLTAAFILSLITLINSKKQPAEVTCNG